MTEGEKPRKYRQLLFPWAEEEAKVVEKQLEQPMRLRGKLSIAALIGGLAAAVFTVSKWLEYVDRRGKMLKAEWDLKYDEHGQPRPEYWSSRTLTEQAMEPSWVKYIQERGDSKQPVKYRE